MKYIQKWGLKILFSGAALSMSFYLQAQSTEHKMQKADSLFALKQYTQSFQLYEEVFKIHSYSPAMLLKMAFIEEGLGHIANSLYYLNLNYKATRNQQVLYKLEEVARKNGLEGYEISASERFLLFIDHNRLNFTAGFGALSFFLLSMIVYTRRKGKSRPYFSFALLVISLGVLVTLANGDWQKEFGIVSDSSVYLMSGPSSGSSVVAIIHNGHRLKIEGRKDVWMKVRWMDSEAYVKESQLLPVQL